MQRDPNSSPSRLQQLLVESQRLRGQHFEDRAEFLAALKRAKDTLEKARADLDLARREARELCSKYPADRNSGSGT